MERQLFMARQFAFDIFIDLCHAHAIDYAFILSLDGDFSGLF